MFGVNLYGQSPYAVNIYYAAVFIALNDSGVVKELLGGRRWVIQKLDNQTWTVKPATGTWTEKTKTSQVWTEKDEIE